MSGRRQKSIRRAAKKARQQINHETWDHTLQLPIKHRAEIAWRLITRNRPVLPWLVAGIGLLILVIGISRM